jgi:hypothetical protein
MRALTVALACVGLAVVWMPSALAGGWAVTTLDPLPSELQAGQTYPIGYVIRQHGQTPFIGAHTAIEIRSSDAQVPSRFVGIADGVPGHYVAQVTFPSAGEWRWDVDQTPFESQALGTITVLDAAASVEPRAPVPQSEAAGSPALWPEPLRLGLPLATAVALVIFIRRLRAYVRAGRLPATTGVGSISSS